MTATDIPISTLLTTHRFVVDNVVTNMPEDHKQFLISFYRREPEWQLIGLEGLDRLPAIRWRELNLDKAGRETRADILRNLKQLLWL